MEGDYQITIEHWLNYLQNNYDNIAKDSRHNAQISIALSTLLIASITAILTNYLLPWSYIGLIISTFIIIYIMLLDRNNRKITLEIMLLMNDIMLGKIKLKEIESRYLGICKKYMNPFMTPEYILKMVPLEERADYILKDEGKEKLEKRYKK